MPFFRSLVESIFGVIRTPEEMLNARLPYERGEEWQVIQANNTGNANQLRQANATPAVILPPEMLGPGCAMMPAVGQEANPNNNNYNNPPRNRRYRHHDHILEPRPDPTYARALTKGICKFITATGYIVGSAGNLSTTPGSCFVSTILLMLGGIVSMIAPMFGRYHGAHYFQSPIARIGIFFLVISVSTFLWNFLPKIWGYKTDFTSGKEIDFICDANYTVQEVSLLKHHDIFNVPCTTLCYMTIATPLIFLAGYVVIEAYEEDKIKTALRASIKSSEERIARYQLYVAYLQGLGLIPVPTHQQLMIAAEAGLSSTQAGPLRFSQAAAGATSEIESSLATPQTDVLPPAASVVDTPATASEWTIVDRSTMQTSEQPRLRSSSYPGVLRYSGAPAGPARPPGSALASTNRLPLPPQPIPFVNESISNFGSPPYPGLR